MKFTAEVVAALATLRGHADNDFERHRIDVLERDLTAPPVVEVIDDHTQVFNGEKFCLCKDGHLKNTQAIHQRVWRYNYGEVPKGYEIHHIDHDKTNNDISNLQLMTRGEHQAHHNPKGSTRKKLQTFVCEVCGKEYQAYKCGSNRFCSSLCRSRYRQQNETFSKTCPQCGKKFETYRSNNATYCSHACAMDAKRKYQPEKRICPICGKEFTTVAYKNQRFCSVSCANKGRKRRN